jgi:hypothetical protein
MSVELLRSQKNEVFMAIKEVGLEPSEFLWSVIGHSLRITHESTNFYFNFGTSEHRTWYLKQYPGDSEAKEVYVGGPSDWVSVLGIFKQWVPIVRREHGEPDLWATAQQDKKLISEKIDDLGNSPFSEAERSRISLAVSELRRFLISSGTHTERQIQFIATRLQHLEEASHRLGRKDWITLAMGTLTNIVVGVALAPDAARELLRTAGALLGWVVGSVHLLP